MNILIIILAVIIIAYLIGIDRNIRIQNLYFKEVIKRLDMMLKNYSPYGKYERSFMKFLRDELMVYGT
ncbi:hypothetical protein C7121_00945 [Paenibacillus glucanolyticus]|jgi:hypothetical protein|nr:hypothetical protein A3958_14270 [Paenibacillus glucanolyticus]AVV54815.1 hypothetical protein C7121_00945 [Paenibacillus glucanolyticus]ETT36367.1 hypothetical protein C169_14074 [Paenibacillus sp. FSL R5-808]